MNLYPYQKDYIRQAKPNWIYDCDTGLGKTVMALAHYRIHFKDKPLCIVAPSSKIKEQGWQRTVEIMCPNIQKLKIVSYNSMPKIKDTLGDHFIIFDESHKIKDSCGVWGKSAFEICRKSAGHIFLSATPLPNNWADAINYLKIFGITKNKTQFLKRFAITSMQWGYQEIVGWRNTKALLGEWQSISKRLNKEDCIDLPRLTTRDVFFNVGINYRKVLKDRVCEDIVYDSAMSWRHGLRQACTTKAKLEYLKDFLDSTKQNVIVFYNYDSELKSIRGVINKEIFQCNGKVKNFPTFDFGDIKNTVTLANYKSGSEGVEFTYADIIIFFSPTESYTEYYQSLGRCHRLKQQNKVTAYKFITRNTIEEDIYHALDSKKDFNFDLWEANRGKEKNK